MSGFDKEYNHSGAHQHFDLILRKLKEFNVDTDSLDYYEMNQEKWDSLIHEALKNGAAEKDVEVIRMMMDN